MSNHFVNFTFQLSSSSREIKSPEYFDNPKFSIVIYPYGRTYKESSNFPQVANSGLFGYGGSQTIKQTITQNSRMECYITCTPQEPIQVNIQAFIISSRSPTVKELFYQGTKSSAAPFQVGGPMLNVSKFNANETLTLSLEIKVSDLNNQSLDTRMLNALYNSELTDCEIIVEKKIIKAHKLILATSSDFFKVMLYGNMKEAATSEIILEHTNYEVMKIFVGYMYGIKITNEILKIHAIELFKLAHQYNVQGLFTLCQVYLVSLLNCDNVSPALELAEKYDGKELKNEAIKFIALNANECISKPNFFTYLNRKLVEEVLKAVASVS